MGSPSLLVIAPPDAPWLEPLRTSGIPYFASLDTDEIASAAPNARVVLNCTGSGTPLKAAWPHLRRLEWLHSLAAGVEGQLIPEVVESPVPMTNSRGVYAPSLGEWAIGAIWFFAKSIDRIRRNQQARRWEQFDAEMMEGKTLGIIGYGAIGKATADRAKALGMRVLAVRRRPEQSVGDPSVERVYPNSSLHEVLPQCDYVVIASALTPETRGLMGKREFALMKPTAVVMNVGRGPVIDEAALLDALQSGAIRGAALDVFDTEPLPEDHPFWTMEQVLISPHCADHIPGWLESAVTFFVENYRRFEAGEALRNVVDKKAGY